MRAASTADAPVAAVVTAAGPAGVSVVRVSGCGALEVGDRLVARAARKPSQQPGGTFFHASVWSPLTGEAVDDALVLVFRAPRSYTGEDVLEIQGHGGALCARRLLDAALAAGARPAAPGEFTRRAFLNGRLDLTQAEAVCDLIQAQTDRAAQAARAQLDGALGRRAGRLYDDLLALCADTEHVLDVDEGDVPEAFVAGAAERAAAARAGLDELAGTWREGHLLRDGALVVISGRPNAGKSSLLNALLGRGRAIVHHEPGTTRDSIEEGCSLSGIPLRLVDTAGLRETGDAVEAEGIARARSAMGRADVNLHLIDLTQPPDAEEQESLAGLDPSRTVVGLAKSDLPWVRGADLGDVWTAVAFSSATGAGLPALKEAVLGRLGVPASAPAGTAVSARHLAELREASLHAQGAAEELAGGAARLVLAASHLRAAAEAVGRITGRVYTDDLLDAIFARFCVGK